MNTLNSWDQNQMNTNLIEFLLNISKFSTLSNDELEMLEKIMLVGHYSNGHKFKSTENIYLIIEGDVAVKYKKDNDVMQLNRIHSGQFFGLFSLTNKIHQPVKCVAAGQVITASLPRTAFELLFNSKLPLADKLRNII
jgi:signal-transduction protein with cAMP-binding, CBS, and nucleotidyltransferase domain